MIARFWRFLSNFKNWIFYSLEHNFWSSQPNLFNDPSKFKFILPLSNAKGLILWKLVELEKIQFKERNLFLGHPVVYGQSRVRENTLTPHTLNLYSILVATLHNEFWFGLDLITIRSGDQRIKHRSFLYRWEVLEIQYHIQF